VAGPPSGLGEPPDSLEDFPLARSLERMHRLSDYTDPWYYSSVTPPGAEIGGRFDLTDPHGTCYWADSLGGAIGEKLLRVPLRAIPETNLHGLHHHQVRPTALGRVANLVAAAARRFGVNLEIYATLDYRLPRLWAAAFHESGFRGLRYKLRSDAAAHHHGLALFGNAGLASRAPTGFGGAMHTELDVASAKRELARRGVTVLPIPRTVPLA
jgi:hypothetical protein